MATLKQIRRRIRSVQSTKQITKAMEMVAAAKLRRAQSKAESARPYAKTMEHVLSNLTGAARSLAHPLFEARETERVMLAVVSSDKGLCGSFNANVIRRAEERVGELGLEPEKIDLVPMGRRGWQYFRRRHWEMPGAIDQLGDQIDLELIQRIGRYATESFLTGQVDRVEFVYTRFVTTSKRIVEVAPLIPIVPETEEEGGGTPYIFEPDAEEIFEVLLPRYVRTRILSVIADSLASEHSARMISMGNATKNADEMIANLTLTSNKLRQAAITGELLEIVGGAVALE